MNTPFVAIAPVVLVGIAMGVSHAQQAPPRLTIKDEAFLSGLLKQFIFDPQAARRVKVPVIYRSPWGGFVEDKRAGWLKTGRVYFSDGANIEAPPPAKIEEIDFRAECRTRFTLPRGQKPDDFDGHFEVMRAVAVGRSDDAALVMAIWLWRIGEKDLAAQALAKSRTQGHREKVPSDADLVAEVRDCLAWEAFAGMVHAYMVRADDEASAHGERLMRLYADKVKHASDEDGNYRQAKSILEELNRRRSHGSYRRDQQWPADFAAWDAKTKLSFLVRNLDEVDTRQNSQPGGVELSTDRRVKELIALGDVAVPTLIDVIDTDERLTRSVHFWRDFARSRTVLGVKEPALVAVMSILQTQFFSSASTGDSFSARGGDAARSLAMRLRAYWKEYGRLPYDERMMRILTQPRTSFEAKRESANNLANLGGERPLRTMFGAVQMGEGPPDRANPVVRKFKDPTTAEAILWAMDEDLAAHDAVKKDDLHDHHRQRIEDDYIFPLMMLKDTRITAECGRRYRAAKNVRMRRKWAYASHYLGDPDPWREVAKQFRRGELRMPENNRRSNDWEQPGVVIV